MSHGSVIGTFQSGLSEWDSSESESVPAAGRTSSGSVGHAGSASVHDRPPLASVTEKSEVSYLALILQLLVAFITQWLQHPSP